MTLDSRDQFIAVLGHDLRSPLASIAGSVQLMALMPDRADEFAPLVEQSVWRMIELIDSMLELARAPEGTGFVVARESEGELEPVLRHVIEEARAGTGRDVVVDIDLRERVRGEYPRIGQVLSNLLVNAFVHGAPDSRIDVRVRAEDGVFELSVTNGGVMTPSAYRGALFGAFVRGETRGRHDRLGLGLHICSEIAKAHMGRIDVVSGDGETRFTFRMPADGSLDGRAVAPCPTCGAVQAWI